MQDKGNDPEERTCDIREDFPAQPLLKLHHGRPRTVPHTIFKIICVIFIIIIMFAFIVKQMQTCIMRKSIV